MGHFLPAIDPKLGLWTKAQVKLSPNCDERPPGTALSLIVVHGISLPPGEYGGPHIERLFSNTLDPTDHDYFKDIHTMRVSAHVLIKRDGQCCQFVPFQKRAWHAGVSQWHGRTACNDFSIGIELEGADHDTYTAQQYQMLNELIDALRKTYPSLSEAPIVGHSDIAPGRKTDPGPLFDWNQVFRRSKA